MKKEIIMPILLESLEEILKTCHTVKLKHQHDQHHLDIFNVRLGDLITELEFMCMNDMFSEFPEVEGIKIR